MTWPVRSEPRAAASSFRKTTSSRGMRKVCMSFSVVENGSVAGGLGLVGIGLPDVLRLHFAQVKPACRSRWVLPQPPHPPQQPRSNELPDPDAPPQAPQPDDICSTALLLRRLGLSSTETADL